MCNHALLFCSYLCILVFSPSYEVTISRNGGEQDDTEKEDEHFCHPLMIDMLLERHKTSIPNHEPKLYCSAAAGTRSVPGFNILSFPDFWGHVPPPGHESVAQRKSSIQRYENIFVMLSDVISFSGDLKNKQSMVFSALEGVPHSSVNGLHLNFFCL